MGALILPSRFNQQPQQAAQIDLANPDAVGLRYGLNAVDGLAAKDFVGGITSTQNGSPSRTVETFGKAISTNGSNQVIGAGTTFHSSAGTLLFLGVTPTIAGQTSVAIQDDGGGSPSLGWMNGNFYVGSASLSSASASALHVLVGTWDGVTVKSYADGQLVASASSSTQPAASSVPFTIGAFSYSGGTVWYAQVKFGLLLYWNRALADDAVKRISANPWQLFKAPQRRLWAVPAASGTSGTLASTLDGAALSAAGSVTDVGAFASTMANAVMVASGTAGTVPTGTFAATMDSFTMAATGTVNNKGVFAATLGDATMSAVGSVIQNATGIFAATMADAVMAAYESAGTSAGSRKHRYLRRNFTS